MFMSGDISSLLLPVVGTILYKAECFSQPEIVVTDGSTAGGDRKGEPPWITSKYDVIARGFLHVILVWNTAL